MTITYILVGIVILLMLIKSWCLKPLSKRRGELIERLHLLATLGEDWQNEKAELQYYQSQSDWSLLKFCYHEASREFEIERMLESDLLNNEGR